MRQDLAVILVLLGSVGCQRGPVTDAASERNGEIDHDRGAKARPAFRTSNEIVRYELSERRADNTIGREDL
jgi:hypothetical protein